MRIAMTFDDGPNCEITPQILDILKENGAVASFFLIADRITAETAAMVLREKAEGHEINNHSLHHGFMDKMTPEEIRHEVSACTEKITELTGEAPHFFRPPFIAVNQTMYDEIGLPFICGLGCEDWVPTVSARQRIDTVLSRVKDGDILLLHDMLHNENTVEAVRVLVPELKKRGYEFVTCSQLFELSGVVPVRNRLYSNVFQTADRVD